MNLNESLAREIWRVAELKCLYEEVGKMPRASTGFAVALMESALQKACEAMGSGDIAKMIGANEALKEFEK